MASRSEPRESGHANPKSAYRENQGQVSNIHLCYLVRRKTEDELGKRWPQYWLHGLSVEVTLAHIVACGWLLAVLA